MKYQDIWTMSVFALAFALLALLFAGGYYESFHSEHYMHSNSLHVVTEGPHAGRGGRCVSQYLFDLKVTLNVDATDKEWQAAWDEKKNDPRWAGHERYYWERGRPRTWVTVWNWQVERIDEVNRLPRYKAEFVPSFVTTE